MKENHMDQPVLSGNRYLAVKSHQELSELSSILRSAKRIGADTETTGIYIFDNKLLGISVSPQAALSYYIPVGHPENPLDFEEIRNWLKNLEDLPWSFHNAKFDWNWLNHTFGVDLNLYADTQVLAHLDDTNRSRYSEQLGLKALAKAVLGIEAHTFEDTVCKIGIPRGYTRAECIKMTKGKLNAEELRNLLATSSVDEMYEYAASDADLTGRLLDKWCPQVPEQYANAFKIEMSIIKPLARMETAGICIDADRVATMQAECEEALATIEPELKKELGPIELDSPRQLESALLGLGIPLSKKTKKGDHMSVDEESLKTVESDYPVVKLLLERKKVAKLRDSFLEKLGTYVHPVTNRIHSSFNQVGVCSGRFSSYDPNMQQQPKKIIHGINFRLVFVPGLGFTMTSTDYNQIELRLILGMSGSPLIQALREGKDIHYEIASVVYGKPVSSVTKEEREDCKRVVYGLSYGMDEYSLARKYNMSIERAKAIMNLFFIRLTGVKALIDRTHEYVQAYGYVETVFGRRCYFPDVKSRDRRLKNRALRGAFNMIMQGTAADINKIGIARVDKLFQKEYNGYAMLVKDRKARANLTVHDELVCEISKELPLKEVITNIETAMCMEIAGAPITVKTKYGSSWGDMQVFGEEKPDAKIEEAEDVDDLEPATAE